MIYDVYGNAFDYAANISVYGDVFCFGMLSTVAPAVVRRGPSSGDTLVRRGVSADDTFVRRGPSATTDTVRR